MEGYPGDPWNSAWTSPDHDKNLQPLNEYPDTAPDLARYFRKHNPFASFHTIQASKERWNRIVGDNAFWTDVQGETLPEYSWFTPDIWNDGHYLYNTHVDTNPRTLLVPQLSAWLQYVFLGDIAAKKVQGSTLPNNLGLNLDIDLVLTDPQAAYAASNIPAGALVVVTFDEADYDAVGYDTNYDGPNQIYTVLLGDMIEPGSNEATPFNHYNLIRTVEENYGLGSLGKNDKGANWFQFLWGKQFQWAAPKLVGLNVSVNANGRAALATLGKRHLAGLRGSRQRPAILPAQRWRVVRSRSDGSDRQRTDWVGRDWRPVGAGLCRRLLGGHLFGANEWGRLVRGDGSRSAHGRRRCHFALSRLRGRSRQTDARLAIPAGRLHEVVEWRRGRVEQDGEERGPAHGRRHCVGTIGRGGVRRLQGAAQLGYAGLRVQHGEVQFVQGPDFQGAAGPGQRHISSRMVGSGFSGRTFREEVRRPTE
jgi:hypothetical protein